MTPYYRLYLKIFYTYKYIAAVVCDGGYVAIALQYIRVIVSVEGTNITHINIKALTSSVSLDVNAGEITWNLVISDQQEPRLLHGPLDKWLNGMITTDIKVNVSTGRSQSSLQQ